MTSFFPFSSSSATLVSAQSVEPLPVEVTVTPSASAFYAGETFRARITITALPRSSATGRSRPSLQGESASRTSVSDQPRVSTSTELSFPVATTAHTGADPPRRTGQIGSAWTATNAASEAGPSRLVGPAGTGTSQVDASASPVEYIDSPSAIGGSLGWPSASPRGIGSTAGSGTSSPIIRNPDRAKRYPSGAGHDRRTRSLAAGKDLSPQEMIWALGGHGTAPPLPSRRTSGPSRIPPHHPHSRKISIASHSQLASPPPRESTEELHSSSDEALHESENPHHPRRAESSTASTPSSTSTSRASLSLSGPPSSSGRISPLPSDRQAPYPSLAPLSISDGSARPPPPPSHPYTRSLLAPREVTVSWAHTRLVAHFHPSNHHIPPDPLLPLRSLLLHQPIGSGSLSATPTSPTGGGGASRWQLSFGTGTIGNESRPSLTGSLVGLASSLVYGGSGGSLEEERKKAWNTKNLPVFETARSLLGVEMKLVEGESRSFNYAIPIPAELPPSHRGRAYKFGWDLVVSLAVVDAGVVSASGKSTARVTQRSKEIEVPIRIWGNVMLGRNAPMYDVLRPIIQVQDQGLVSDAIANLPAGSVDGQVPTTGRKARPGDSQASLESYARRLLQSVSHNDSTTHDHSTIESQADDFSQPIAALPKSPLIGTSGSGPNGHAVPANGRSRKGSFIQGDDELVEDSETGCGQAVEILSRASPKASYDIAKDGTLVAVLTLIKTTYRLGETVLGVLAFNWPSDPSARAVLKISTFLESHDRIPTPLLPLSPRGGRAAQPQLVKVHAEQRAGYAVNMQRMSFSLDIPSDATPGFSFIGGSAAADIEDGAGEREKEPGEEEQAGGVEWKVRVAFLVAVPPNGGVGPGRRPATILPTTRDKDNQYFTASASLAPSIPVIDTSPATGSKAAQARSSSPLSPVKATGAGSPMVIGWEESGVETVECEIPIRVLAGNTAFRVKTSSHIL